MGVLGVLGPILNNDHFFWFPLQSYSYKNTVGAVACLFFSDPPLAPHATNANVTKRLGGKGTVTKALEANCPSD